MANQLPIDAAATPSATTDSAAHVMSLSIDPDVNPSSASHEATTNVRELELRLPRFNPPTFILLLPRYLPILMPMTHSPCLHPRSIYHLILCHFDLLYMESQRLIACIDRGFDGQRFRDTCSLKLTNSGDSQGRLLRRRQRIGQIHHPHYDCRPLPWRIYYACSLLGLRSDQVAKAVMLETSIKAYHIDEHSYDDAGPQESFEQPHRRRE
mmetsp:Transcript_3071/g.4719  ORF Transcript_3071/g.4719 Transcript_3071/m.4719 type:complete len:210 (+) Transcript_3071:196-825(+)